MIKNEEYYKIFEAVKDLPEMEERTSLFDEAPKVNINFVNYIKNATKKVKLQRKDWNFTYPLDSGLSIRDTNDKLFDFTRIRSTDNISEIWLIHEVTESFPFMLEPIGEDVVLSEDILSRLLDKKLHFEFQSLCTWEGEEIEVRVNDK